MVRHEYRGKELVIESVNKLKVNKSTKGDVMAILGTPSSSSSFDDNTWYYISLKKKGISVLNPKITERKIVRLKFRNNILAEIKTYEGAEVGSIAFNKDKTKVAGAELTVLKEFTRNLGRYNK
jgi:outer membrane protein assembly factor BamE (lipoprotein component of BamABCDE complex)